MTLERPDWDLIWLEVAHVIAHRSLCTAAQVCAIITDKHNRLISTGYNGPPAGFPHHGEPCDVWCSRRAGGDPQNAFGDSMFFCPAVHAEANALLSGDRSRWEGGTMYVIKHPCQDCCKLIANSGIERLVIRPVNETPADHHSHQTYDFMEKCGVTVEVFE